MNCVKCGKEFTPLSCPTCGNTLDAGTCPACNEGQRIKCGTCGQELEIARVDPAPAETSAAPIEAASPHGGPPTAEAPAAPPQQPTAPVPPAYTPPPQQPQAAPEPPAFTQPPQPQSPPQYGTPGQQPPPYGQPAQPPQGAPGQGYAPPAYAQQSPGAVPPPYNAPGQPGQPNPYGDAPFSPIPRQKVRLGGWLMCFFVFTIIGLVFSCFGLIGNLVTLSWVSVIVSAVCNILPLVMIIYFISKRSWKFFGWYKFLAIVGFVSAGLMIFASIAGRTYLSDLMEDALQAALLQPSFYESAELYSSALDSYNLPELMVNYLIGFVVVIAVITVAWYLCWWIYLKRSKRVAYTFDPKNNPPA